MAMAGCLGRGLRRRGLDVEDFILYPSVGLSLGFGIGPGISFAVRVVCGARNVSVRRTCQIRGWMVDWMVVSGVQVRFRFHRGSQSGFGRFDNHPGNQPPIQ